MTGAQPRRGGGRLNSVRGVPDESQQVSALEAELVVGDPARVTRQAAVDPGRVALHLFERSDGLVGYGQVQVGVQV